MTQLLLLLPHVAHLLQPHMTHLLQPHVSQSVMTHDHTCLSCYSISACPMVEVKGMGQGSYWGGPGGQAVRGGWASQASLVGRRFSGAAL